MQTVFLVQHCQSRHPVEPRARLWPDSRNGLTELGQRQAQCLAQRLRREIDRRACQVYTSPMKRALETAEIISDALGAPPQTVYDLHEFNGRFALERTQDGEEWPADDADWSLFD